MMRQLYGSLVKKYLMCLLIVGICLLPTATSQAVSLYWNAPSGGAGTWDTTNMMWSTLAAGPLDTIWNNANLDDAVFQNAGGAVVVDLGGITVHNIDFNVTGY